MFWNRIFTNSLVFVVKDETFNFDWISLETSAILSQVIKLLIHAASPDFIRIFYHHVTVTTQMKKGLNDGLI